jgi:predicted DNA-binding transcriptional regulator AlpA
MTHSTTKQGAAIERLLTPKETANALRVSASWLAKARMKGDGPPYTKIGNAVRYRESVLTEWMKGRQRLSTSQR